MRHRRALLLAETGVIFRRILPDLPAQKDKNKEN